MHLDSGFSPDMDQAKLVVNNSIYKGLNVFHFPLFFATYLLSSLH